MIDDFFQVFDCLPGWPSIGPNPTVVPSPLLVLRSFQDEVVQFYDVRIL